MQKPGIRFIANLADGVRYALSRIEILAFFPLLGLGAIWLGQTGAILATCFLLPTLLALQALRPTKGQSRNNLPKDNVTGLPLREEFQLESTAVIEEAVRRSRHTACLVAEIDEFSDLSARWGSVAHEEILRRSAERLRAAIRRNDFVATIGEARFAVLLEPIQSAKLDVVLSLIERLQSAMAEPIAIDGTAIHPSVSVGFATPEQCGNTRADTLLDAALTALVEARRNGPSAIRGYSDKIKTGAIRRNELAEEVDTALNSGAIQPWFQPQVSTDTGEISGFEALARWHHPEHGVILPFEFLPAIEDAGCMTRLGECILTQSLHAMKSWEATGFKVPSVSVNFSAEELRDPTLAERIKWEVDRFELNPSRLTVEILETVAASSEDDVIVQNIKKLGNHGFNMDLDDFGTGQSSIANIARFQVNRIKIDRSFVTRMDHEPSQRAVVAGILALAERLGVSTIAEGVETKAEQSILAQLGCDYLQGFGLARPMPFEDTIAWIREHNRKIAKAPRIGRRAG